MKDCPECGHRMKDHHQTCMKCGAECSEPEPAAPPKEAPRGARQHLEKAKYLQELVPSRSRLSELLPHPTGWVLGIGLPVILALAIIHAMIYPVSADANGKKTASKSDVSAAQQSRFKRCLHQARAKADFECGKISGTAQGVRRMTCTVARLSADYTRCTTRLGGRFGHCLGRCGQTARSCSSTCATGASQSWMDTAKCLLPCWKDRLQTCVSSCFQSRTLDAAPAPDPTPSAI